MRPAAALVAVAAIAACSRYGDLPRVSDPAGHVSFALLHEATPATNEGRSAWRMRNGVVVTTQRVPFSDALVRERTVEDVARALGARFSLGEVAGTLSERECTVAGRDTVCLHGHVDAPEERGGGRYLKRGVLLPVGDQIVLIEVVGPIREREAVERQALVLEQTIEVL
jgi:hypothetical protein